MTTPERTMRCQRCGAQMEMRDPLPGGPWKPDQFWVCPKCGRHFWTTHPNPPNPPKAAASEPPAPAVPGAPGGPAAVAP